MTDLITTIETDLKTAGKWLETEFETEAVAAWDAVKAAFLKTEPVIVADLSAIAQAVIAELGASAPMGDILTGILNSAEAAGKTAIKDLESNLLGGLVSLAVSAATL